ncbi:ABC transporter substrate-binding protein [Lacrimispora sp. 210928-DFI.3.58]|uniref:ABC transporter substrate-binding protein n=1 Tax=Lacrimispora sp. 210928-DFI.3.58 TaxID=2883214 RepID=UPI001D07F6D0|nr:ABC transporter substrate-binding protein [Lacrimispora sp. 210928-DFI.3.58]MCB7318259.1 ABC transporter substrate-binding protein [Lacrimispora sp. 210928-DFI.3.58]
MRMQKRLFGVLLTAMVALSVTACGNGSNNIRTQNETGVAKETSADGVIKIAVAASMTGENAEYGKQMQAAAEIMAEKWNKDGGVVGKQIEIVPYDDKNSGDESATVAQKIVEDKDIIGVIGHFSSNLCLIADPIYQENEVIAITTSGSHPDITGIGDFIFRNNSIISTEANYMLQIAIEDFGCKKIGIVSIKTDWGTTTSNTLKELLETNYSDSGAMIVAHEEIITGSDDFSPIVTKMEEEGAQVILCVGEYGLTGPLAKQYRQINPDIKLVGTSNAFSQQLLNLAGDSAEGLRFPISFFAGSQDPKVKDFVDEFDEKYGGLPNSFAAQTYDATGMLLEAIKNAGTTDHRAVRDELTKLAYPGVTGDTNFDENGDAAKSYTKVEIQNGEFVEVK